MMLIDHPYQHYYSIVRYWHYHNVINPEMLTYHKYKINGGL